MWKITSHKVWFEIFFNEHLFSSYQRKSFIFHPFHICFSSGEGRGGTSSRSRAASNWNFQGGAKWCNLLLYLKDTYVWENFGRAIARLPPLVAHLPRRIQNTLRSTVISNSSVGSTPKRPSKVGDVVTPCDPWTTSGLLSPGCSQEDSLANLF